MLADFAMIRNGRTKKSDNATPGNVLLSGFPLRHPGLLTQAGDENPFPNTNIYLKTQEQKV